MTNAAAGNLMIVPEELRRGQDETSSWRPCANSAHARPRLVLGASCGAPARSRRRDFRNRRVRRLVHQWRPRAPLAAHAVATGRAPLHRGRRRLVRIRGLGQRHDQAV